MFCRLVLSTPIHPINYGRVRQLDQGARPQQISKVPVLEHYGRKAGFKVILGFKNIKLAELIYIH